MKNVVAVSAVIQEIPPPKYTGELTGHTGRLSAVVELQVTLTVMYPTSPPSHLDPTCNHRMVLW